MALSMEEQRILDEMERRLADDDPRLASRLASHGSPGLGGVLRSPRARVLAVLLALSLIVAVTLMLYAMMPFRAVSGRGSHTRAPAAPSRAVSARTSAAGRLVDAQVRPGQASQAETRTAAFAAPPGGSTSSQRR